MNQQTKNILVVDDEKGIRKTISIALVARGFKVETAASANEAFELLQDKYFDLILLDLRLPDLDGVEVLKIIKERYENIIIIIITGFGSIDSAVEAMRLGAYDYISKPLKMEQIDIIIDKAFEKKALIEENIELKDAISSKYVFHNIVSISGAMKKACELAEQVSQTTSNVLILGESGTGKELIANAIHLNSPRKDKKFVKLNCAALPEQLLESELFGYEKGAFTDAHQLKKGRIEIANEGDLLLDEIGDMPKSIQAKFLRFIEDKEICRLGGIEPIKLDVRIIYSTNTNLEKAIKDGTFREDLFYRINTISIKLPPLRERKEDIPILVEHFISRFNKAFNKNVTSISPEALDTLTRQDWPGNVRQLENVIERAFVLDIKDILLPKHLPFDLRIPKPEVKVQLPPEGVKLKEIERIMILKTFEMTGGNKTKAADILGLSRETLRLKLEEYEKESLPQ